MGNFVNIKKIKFNLIFLQGDNLTKAGFHKVNQKKNRVPAQKKKSGWLLPYNFSRSCPKKSQVAPTKSLSRVQIKQAVVQKTRDKSVRQLCHTTQQEVVSFE